MPHSSGGGSHGGGSHGGGSHSHSGGSHGSCHTINGTYYRVMHTRFTGSKRYVKYGDNGPEYLYANYDISKRHFSLRYLLLLFYIPFYVVIIWMLVNSVDIPVKITANYENEIIIKDNIGILNNQRILKNQLYEFQKKTGITPYILTVHNEDWSKYRDLKSFAHNYYVKNFKDEYHWLIVYSEPAVVEDFNDWYWEGMQGDDTDNILSSSVTEDFTDYMQNQLIERDAENVDLIIADAFAEIMPGIMSLHIQYEIILVMLFSLAFITVHCYFMVFHDREKKNYRGYVLAPEEAAVQGKNAEEKCRFCGTIYKKATTNYCPNCGVSVFKHTS